MDWPNIFNCLNAIRDELKEFFPYKHIRVNRCEADDIIGTICHQEGVAMGDGKEKILILSGDKDFIQLQVYSNVSQYDPVRKKMVKHNDPAQYLLEHIAKGDRGDGIPNALSADDTFVSGGRQKPMRANRLEEILSVVQDNDDSFKLEHEWAAGYQRNEVLVDLINTPDELQEQILEQFEVDPGGRDGLFKYFVKKRLNNLIENISEF